MNITTFEVAGLTCQHCVQAVTAELGALPGVSTVDVDLKPGQSSVVTVTGSSSITDAQVAAALDEAGDYRLA